MDVLIVGGTGVISTAVVSEAVRQGISITCINRGNNHGVAPNPDVKTIHFDVRDRKVADEHLKGLHFDVVVDFICFNADQVRYSLDLFHDKCSQYVFISTDSVYKLQKDGHYDENTPQSNPEWNYSYQKSECEDIVRQYCKEHGVTYTIVRPSITYGNTRIPYGLMPKYGFHGTLVERIKAGKAIPVWNEGKNWQTVMRIEDFAVGMVGLWCNPHAFNNDFGICGESVRWSDVLDAVDTILGMKSVRVDVTVDSIIKVFPNRRGEFVIDRAEDHIVSNKKLKDVVPSFYLSYDLLGGIQTTMNYYQSNNNVLGIDYQYDGQMDRIAAKVGGGKLGFVNYENSHFIRHCHDYFLGRYGGFLLVKVLEKIESFTKRIARRVL